MMPDPAALLASTADLLDHLGRLTGDPRFRHAHGVLRGKRAGRRFCDDATALAYARSLFDAGLVRSKNRACLQAAVMYSERSDKIDATRARLMRKLRHK